LAVAHNFFVGTEAEAGVAVAAAKALAGNSANGLDADGYVFASVAHLDTGNMVTVEKLTKSLCRVESAAGVYTIEYKSSGNGTQIFVGTEAEAGVAVAAAKALAGNSANALPPAAAITSLTLEIVAESLKSSVTMVTSPVSDTFPLVNVGNAVLASKSSGNGTQIFVGTEAEAGVAVAAAKAIVAESLKSSVTMVTSPVSDTFPLVNVIS
jgi:nucleoside 2-deoxyribosyltransferase